MDNSVRTLLLILILLLLTANAWATNVITVTPPGLRATDEVVLHATNLGGEFILLETRSAQTNGPGRWFRWDARRNRFLELRAFAALQQSAPVFAGALSEDGNFVLAWQLRNRRDTLTAYDIANDRLEVWVSEQTPGMAADYTGRVEVNVLRLGIDSRDMTFQVITVQGTFGTILVNRGVYRRDGFDGSLTRLDEDGQFTLDLSLDNRIRWWRSGSRDLLFREDISVGQSTPVPGPVDSARFSPAGNVVASVAPGLNCDSECRLRWHDLETDEFHIVRRSDGPLFVRGLSYLGHTLFFTDGNAFFRWVRGQNGPQRLAAFDILPEDVSFQRYHSPDGRLIARQLGQPRNAVLFADAQTGQSVDVAYDESRCSIEFNRSGIRLTDRGMLLATECPPQGTSGEGGVGRLYYLSASVLRPHEADVRTVFEQPASGAASSGIGTAHGWAMADDGRIERVELWVDGAFKTTLPLGGSRQDVANAYPDRPNAGRSGYAASFELLSLEPGYHRVESRIVLDDGQVLVRGANIASARVSADFLPSPNTIQAEGVQAYGDGQRIVVDGLEIAGQARTVVLEWQPTRQQFVIVEVR
jgi:hypothetical protein